MQHSHRAVSLHIEHAFIVRSEATAGQPPAQLAADAPDYQSCCKPWYVTHHKLARHLLVPCLSCIHPKVHTMPASPLLPALLTTKQV